MKWVTTSWTDGTKHCYLWEIWLYLYNRFVYAKPAFDAAKCATHSST